MGTRDCEHVPRAEISVLGIATRQKRPLYSNSSSPAPIGNWGAWNRDGELRMARNGFLQRLGISSGFEKRRRNHAHDGAPSCRLRLEPLEERTMPSAGTWQPLAPTNPASGPTNTQVALLLSDGTLMVQ